MASEWVVWREAEREKAGQGDSGYIGGGFKCPAKEFHPPIHSFIHSRGIEYLLCAGTELVLGRQQSTLGGPRNLAGF